MSSYFINSPGDLKCKAEWKQMQEESIDRDRFYRLLGVLGPSTPASASLGSTLNHRHAQFFHDLQQPQWPAAIILLFQPHKSLPNCVCLLLNSTLLDQRKVVVCKDPASSYGLLRSLVCLPPAPQHWVFHFPLGSVQALSLPPS
jgi:hypothetical protein